MGQKGGNILIPHISLEDSKYVVTVIIDNCLTQDCVVIATVLITLDVFLDDYIC